MASEKEVLDVIAFLHKETVRLKKQIEQLEHHNRQLQEVIASEVTRQGQEMGMYDDHSNPLCKPQNNDETLDSSNRARET